jgi:hypothetical protein
MSDVPDHLYTRLPLTSFYFGEEYQNPNSFFCVPYAFDIYIEQFFARLLFRDDMTRIVYAPESMMFRERDRKNEGNLNPPYFTYYLNNIDTGTQERQLFSHQANIVGIDLDLVDGTGIKIRTAPVTLNYTCSFITNQPKDKLYMATMLAQVESNETVFYADIVVEGSTKPIRNPGFVKLSIDTSPNFEEDEWLEKNQLLIISMDMSIETVMLYSHTSGFAITEEVILNFLTSKNLIDIDVFPTSEGILEVFHTYLNPGD